MNRLSRQLYHASHLKRNHHILIRKLAVVCSSIFLRQHFKFIDIFSRKQTPIENTQTSPIAVKSEDEKAFESPPPSNRQLDKPPPLKRGKKRIATIVKSETQPIEENGKIKTSEIPEKVYNLRNTSNDTDGASDNKFKIEPEEATKSNCTEIRPRRKRQVRSEISEVYPVKQLRSGTRVGTKKNPTQKALVQKPLPVSIQQQYKTVPNIDSKAVVNTPMPASCSNSSTSQPATSSNSTIKQYSDLKYLESFGSIRTIRKVKHPGINKVPTSKVTNIATPFISPESQNGWDRKTKLKLSYRHGSLGINDIQFALIIYEPVAMGTRRNLLEEFERAAAEEETARARPQQKPIEPVKTILSGKVSDGKITKPKLKNDRLVSLRRLRF